jgi:alkylation response protein AidB-like acyl-CoA dehydrogenase
LSLDLAFDDIGQAIGGAVAQMCRERASDAVLRAQAGSFPRELWSELAELGGLALCTPEGEGGPLELVAACESLGRAVFPGPLAATFLATQLLPATERARVAQGESVVSVGAGRIWPWAPAAQLFVEVAGARAWLMRPSALEPVGTLGGEPWGRGALERERDLGNASAALALHDTALAAYLAGAGQRLVDAASEHARTRVQFGKAIGEFQGVALPLADCRIRLDGAEMLARQAGYALAQEHGGAAVHAAAARLSACSAALATANVCHQVFGAVGITLEGQVFHVSRRIRQLANQPPGADLARAALLESLGLGVAA